jgi:hypothetical protein
MAHLRAGLNVDNTSRNYSLNFESNEIQNETNKSCPRNILAKVTAQYRPVLKKAAGEKVLQRGNQPGEELQVYHVRKLCQALQHRPCRRE